MGNLHARAILSLQIRAVVEQTLTEAPAKAEEELLDLEARSYFKDLAHDMLLKDPNASDLAVFYRYAKSFKKWAAYPEVHPYWRENFDDLLPVIEHLHALTTDFILWKDEQEAVLIDHQLIALQDEHEKVDRKIRKLMWDGGLDTAYKMSNLIADKKRLFDREIDLIKRFKRITESSPREIRKQWNAHSADDAVAILHRG